MNSTSACFSRVLGLFFGTLFVIATVIALLVFNISRQLSNSDAYKQALRNQDVYAQVPALIADQITLSPDSCTGKAEGCENEPGKKESAQDYLKSLKKTDWENVLVILMPPDWIQAQAEGLIEQFFTYLNSGQPQLSLNINMVDFKNRFRGREGQQAFLQLLRAQPACTTDQLLTMQKIVQNPSIKMEELPICLPPDQFLNDAAPQIGAVLGKLADTIPDQIDLAASSQADPAQQQSIASFRVDYQRINQFAGIFPLLSIGLLLLIGVVVIRSFKDLLAWWGIPFLIAGILSIIVALMFVPAVNGAVASAIAHGQIPISNMAPSIIQTFQNVVRAMASSVSVWMGVEAGILTVIGLAMTGIFFLTSL